MYAPKFQSWLSTWDRFDAALSYQIDTACDAALGEIRKMADKYKEEFANPPKATTTHEADQLAWNLHAWKMQEQQMKAMQNDPFGYQRQQALNSWGAGCIGLGAFGGVGGAADYRWPGMVGDIWYPPIPRQPQPSGCRFS